MKTQTITHVLPPLPYAAAALEPHIDARTMLLHHDKHHATYVEALNEALESAPDKLRAKSAEWLLTHLHEVPEDIRTAVHNNGGGHVNHSMLWKMMSPDGGGEPGGALAEALDQAFGSVAVFKKKFEEAGAKHFASGWVWLVKIGDKLQVVTTSGHDNPIMQGQVPLLVNDVWEHAYYLKHENRRPEYLKGWWKVVNWDEVGKRLEAASETAAEASA